jgi:F-type H+-transporting ATPase subunit alpha
MNSDPGIVQDELDTAFAGIDRALEAYKPELKLRDVGTVTTVTTGVATLTGLPGVGFEESVVFSNGMTGIAFNIDQDQVGVVLLGDYEHAACR